MNPCEAFVLIALLLAIAAEWADYREERAERKIAKRGGEFSGAQVSRHRRNAGTIQKAQQMGLV